ncbi:hypothetical protein [Leptospira adleri]|uniref:Uncharacterized protein n=1 Tax=Leptospira adleri TaxID=2023186 RepID=A0A2M9YJE1_9LEPT|nr:hypothetical protein [Leptospira adleri]PJZ51616.1 hypothetical protein CH380_19410 [Leptospira adleri]PJZ61875.1 hypothetical protein CH376_10755 [Leptospira adleri]
MEKIEIQELLRMYVEGNTLREIAKITNQSETKLIKKYSEHGFKVSDLKKLRVTTRMNYLSEKIGKEPLSRAEYKFLNRKGYSIYKKRSDVNSYYSEQVLVLLTKEEREFVEEQGAKTKEGMSSFVRNLIKSEMRISKLTA